MRSALSRRSLAALLLPASLVVAGCDETSVYLVIHARLRIPAQLDALCVRLGTGGTPQFSRRYPLTEREAGTPRTLSVAKGQSAHERFEVMLHGERRGRRTSSLRQTLSFDPGAVSRADLYVQACGGASSGALFEPARRLTSDAGSAVAGLEVHYAPAQVVALWPGGAWRFAQVDGQVHRISGALPAGPTLELRELHAADLDGDCDLDLLLVGTDGVRFWQNDGNGTFSAAGTILAPATPRAAAVADLDGDGRGDLLVGGEKDTWLLVQEGAVPGSFRRVTGRFPATAALSDVTALDTGFINDDEYLDIVIGRGNTSVADNLVLLAAPGGGGSFVAGPVLAGKARTTSVAVVDLTGDRLCEVVVGNRAAASVVYDNNRGALTGSKSTALPGSGASDTVTQVLAVDLDNDCDNDLVLAGPGGVRVLVNAGLGTLAVPTGGSTLVPATRAAAVDVDGDGKLDLLLGGNASGAAWLRQR